MINKWTKIIRTKLKKVSSRNRLSIFRSNNHIYAQAIDDIRLFSNTASFLANKLDTRLRNKDVAKKRAASKATKTVGLSKPPMPKTLNVPNKADPNSQAPKAAALFQADFEVWDQKIHLSIWIQKFYFSTTWKNTGAIELGIPGAHPRDHTWTSWMSAASHRGESARSGWNRLGRGWAVEEMAWEIADATKRIGLSETR